MAIHEIVTQGVERLMRPAARPRAAEAAVPHAPALAADTLTLSAPRDPEVVLRQALAPFQGDLAQAVGSLVSGVEQAQAAAIRGVRGDALAKPLLEGHLKLYNRLIGPAMAAIDTRSELALAKEVVPDADPQLSARLQTILDRLAAHSPRKDVPYQARCLDDDGFGAFIYGHQVGVNRGTLAFARSEAEVAGILAHEITHGEKRHGLQGELAERLNAMVLETARPTTPPELLTGLQEAGELAVLAFMRRHEHEADAGAVRLMRAAGYDPQAFADVLARTQPRRGFGRSLPFMEQHPPTAERVAHIQRAAQPEGGAWWTKLISGL